MTAVGYSLADVAGSRMLERARARGARRRAVRLEGVGARQELEGLELDNRIARRPRWTAGAIHRDRCRYLNRRGASWFYKGSPSELAGPPELRMVAELNAVDATDREWCTYCGRSWAWPADGCPRSEDGAHTFVDARDLPRRWGTR